MDQNELSCLRIHLTTGRPVDLLDFSISLASLANEYADFTACKGGGTLLVKDVRHGSIEIDLVDASALLMATQMVMPFIATTNVIADFFEHIKKFFAFFKGEEVSSSKIPYSKKTLENASNMLRPVAKDKASQIVLSPIFNGPVMAPVTINFNEANLCQNKISAAIEAKDKLEEERIVNCSLRWFQTRNDSDANTGDKVIIASLSSSPLRAEFKDASVKALFLACKENFFKMEFMATLVVRRAQGKPKSVVIETLAPVSSVV